MSVARAICGTTHKKAFPGSVWVTQVTPPSDRGRDHRGGSKSLSDHTSPVACVRLVAVKIGRERVSAQCGVAKHACSARVADSEVVGGESGEFG